MSRPTFLRCAAFFSAALVTAVLIACFGPISFDETTDTTPPVPFISVTLVACPLVRALLSP
jgi:hypothetical protein